MMRLRVRYIEDQPSEVHPNHEPTLWLRNEFLAIQHGVARGTIGTCGHLGPGVPALVTLYRPDFAACARCAPAEHGLTRPEDYRCDRCQRIVLDDPDDQISPCVLMVGPDLGVGFGLCDNCLSAEVPPL